MISLLFAGLLAQAQPNATYFEQFSTPLMEVIGPGSKYAEPERYKESWLYNFLHLGIFTVNPTGEQKWISERCSPVKWQDSVIKKSGSFHQWGPLYSQYWNDCEKELQTGRNNLLTNFLEMVNYPLDLQNYPVARFVMFHLPNNIELKGVLAMKTDGKKRPLVIFRTGIFSRMTEFITERPLFMQMFEQSPFNVLVLESITGFEFLNNNSDFSVGGFDEGTQNFYVAREIQKASQPLSKLISSVHFMGVSMGAQGMLYGTLLNELNGKKVVRSTLTYCPLLNMKDTFQGHMSGTYLPKVVNWWTAKRMQKLKDKIPDLNEEHFVPQAFAYVEKNYQGPLIQEKNKKLDFILPVGKEDFWSRNDFWPAFKNVQTPILIMSTEKDPIVTWELNSGRIESGMMNLSDSNVRFLKMSEGYHCSLGVAYDWAALSIMAQTFILKNSPEFQLEEKRKILQLNELQLLKQGQSQSQSQILKPLTIKSKMKAEIGSTDILAMVSFDGGPEMEIRLPVADLEYPYLSPISKESQSLWTRWANQNINAMIEGDNLVLKWKVTK